MMQIEICAASIQSALHAQAGGADRIELCDNLWEGGSTPSAGSIRTVRKAIDIGLFVLIRPRGGDFLYSDLEFEAMLEDIRLAKQWGADGIVSGVLCSDGQVDIMRSTQLVEAAYPLPFTFHRAFDCSIDLADALEAVLQCGATRILSSGGKNSAPEGLDLLAALQSQANGRIEIMPGGGLSPQNILSIAEKTGCSNFHLSAKMPFPSQMQFQKMGLRMNGSKDIAEDNLWVSGIELIQEIRQLLDKK